MQDTTHTAFSPSGACPDTDYIAGQPPKMDGGHLRRAGIQTKRTLWRITCPRGTKNISSIRDRALRAREAYERTGDEAWNKKSTDAFWEAEWMLRRSSICRKATANLF